MNRVKEEDLSIIKDRSKRLAAKKELKLNRIISSIIYQDTYINKCIKTKTNMINELSKPDSIYKNITNNTSSLYLNKMPYLIFGLVESVFVDEEKSEKTKEFGCGYLIDSNIILLPSKNLLFDNDSINEQKTNESKDNNENNYNFKLFEIDFKPLNISPEYRSYLPKAIKVIDHYTPMTSFINDIEKNESKKKNENESQNKIASNNNEEEIKKENSEEEIFDEGKLLNSWGLAVLEYPIGEVINFIYNESLNNNYNNKFNKPKIIKNKAGSLSKDENRDSIINELSFKNLSNQEVGQCDIHFLECYPKKEDSDNIYNMTTPNMKNNICSDENIINTQSNTSKRNVLKEQKNINNLSKNTSQKSGQNLTSNSRSHTANNFPKAFYTENQNDIYNEFDDDDDSHIYHFFESYYDMEFDTNLIYLSNLNQNQIVEENIIPGFIIGTYMKKYYLLGMNTNTMIKYSLNENEKEDTKQEGEDQKTEAQNNKNDKDNKDNDTYLYHIAIRFTGDIIDQITSKIIEFNERYPNEMNFNKNIFSILTKKIKSKTILLNLLKNNCEGLYKLILTLKNDKSISNYDKSCLDLIVDENLKFIRFALMLLWNKYTSSLMENKIIDIENSKLGYFPGSSILSSIIQSKESLATLNLKNNELFSEGIKEIMLPIFNKKKLLDIGKDLKCLCLDSNKLNGKSLKYIRYLIKVAPQLNLISLSNNDINGSSLKHLINASKGKDSMYGLYLNSNLLGNSCGEDLNQILINFNNLKELNLSCNTLGDEPIPYILNALKQNNKIENLLLSNNEITKKSASSIANFLSNNRNLKILWINNNHIDYEGIKMLSQVLSTKLVLEELNLNSVHATDEGGKEIFENLKLNKSIRKIYLNSNELGKLTMEKFGEFMDLDNKNENSEQGLEVVSFSLNCIDDECVQYFVNELIEYRWLNEIKFNSNLITDEGRQLILFAVIQNTSINKINLENNKTTWNIFDDKLKLCREDLQVFL